MAFATRPLPGPPDLPAVGDTCGYGRELWSRNRETSSVDSLASSLSLARRA